MENVARQVRYAHIWLIGSFARDVAVTEWEDIEKVFSYITIGRWILDPFTFGIVLAIAFVDGRRGVCGRDILKLDLIVTIINKQVRDKADLFL